MKKKEERMEKQMNEIMAENKRLTEPLQKAREEVEELRKQVRINGYTKFLPLFRLDLSVKNLTQLSLPPHAMHHGKDEDTLCDCKRLGTNQAWMTFTCLFYMLHARFIFLALCAHFLCKKRKSDLLQIYPLASPILRGWYCIVSCLIFYIQ